jgi:hypothetical protein
MNNEIEHSVLTNLETILTGDDFKGANSTFYDAFSKIARCFVELKNYSNVKKNVVPFKETDSYKDAIEQNNNEKNTFWLYLKSEINNLYKLYLEACTNDDEELQDEYTKLIEEKLNTISTDGIFDINKFNTLFRQSFDYVGIPIAINKFPEPSKEKYNENISPNSEDEIKHIIQQRKTEYNIIMNNEYRVNSVVSKNNTSGKRKTEKLTDTFFNEGEAYDVIFCVLLKDALLYFNLSEYLREKQTEAINLFAITDTFYTDKKLGSYDSLNIPIDLFTSVNLGEIFGNKKEYIKTINREIEAEKQKRK